MYQRTLEREEYIRSTGANVVVLWEHEFLAIQRTREFKRWLSSHEIISRLHPRDAFFGGRTNATQLYYQLTDEEIAEGCTIRYVDFTSLYPWVNKYGEYPLSHPEVILEPSIDKLYSG